MIAVKDFLEIILPRWAVVRLLDIVLNYRDLHRSLSIHPDTFPLTRESHSIQADNLQKLVDGLQTILSQKSDSLTCCFTVELLQYFYSLAKDRQELFREEYEAREPGTEAKRLYQSAFFSAFELSKQLAIWLV